VESASLRERVNHYANSATFAKSYNQNPHITREKARNLLTRWWIDCHIPCRRLSVVCGKRVLSGVAVV
jgi:hypothetical protein